ncbi:hypothetical protein SAMN05421805_104131 [Saccharopolyspora antimicrobica]|uniref:Uncharacterized protein n=1 Tax=Saccharopolyspora antimicrobica TaxID=455193 RepID=A0A1I4YG17_9PSEU|nr:hypothetical protein ATL45_0915 [Saccharopolyspora antimicrobica]SFN36985.1 hypothetical protein SAMN05421805_104131 [Saccharopolyspora antimicrobica]
MQFGVAAFITDEGIGPADLGRALEERDLDALFAADHTHIPASLSPTPRQASTGPCSCCPTSTATNPGELATRLR